MNERPLSTRPARRTRPLALVVAGVSAIVLAVLLAAGTTGGDDPQTAATSDSVVAAGGVEVEGADVHLGEVPLDTTVEPTWTLLNTSGSAVSLGQPHAEVLEGCCPGPLTVDAQQLAPGEKTVLRFPLQMHAGMDGPHDFDVHVPIATAAGEQEVLTVGVDGNFGG